MHRKEIRHQRQSWNALEGHEGHRAKQEDGVWILDTSENDTYKYGWDRCLETLEATTEIEMLVSLRWIKNSIVWNTKDLQFPKGWCLDASS